MGDGTRSDQPNIVWDDSDPGNGGGFVNLRRGDPDRAQVEAEYAARVRAMVGDEAYERIGRSRALGLNPRPLTGEEKVILGAAVAPLLRDMEATGQALPGIREEAHEDLGEDAVCAWIQEPGSGCGQGIRVLCYYSPGEQLCSLAEQVQDWAADVQVDPGRRPWPDCPDHPGSHALIPDTRDGTAVWCCPQGGHVIAEIGLLPGPRRPG
jgi:hypothetical protein